jgi:arabinogalactan oligomer/maltooligosaccharide transport system substrate-binding protein
MPRSLGGTLPLIIVISVFFACIPLRSYLLEMEELVGELELWIGLEYVEMSAVQKIIEDFKDEEDVAVKLVWIADIKSMRSRYRVGAPIGMGPDVLLAPHDWIGEFVEMGVIAPIPENIFPANERAKFLDKSIEAVTLGDNIWAFPCLLESLVLIYNEDYVSDIPETWDNLIELAKQLMTDHEFYGFYYPHVDPYYSFPIMSGYGAYVFGENENFENIGLATSGAIEAAQYIQDMVHVHEILPIDTALNPYMVRDAFVNGDAAMIIDGPWAFGRLEEEGMNYGVATLPTLPENRYPRTFVGVQVSMVNSRSEDLEDAMKLAKYLSNASSQRQLHEAGWRIPTRQDVLSEVENKPEVEAVLEQAENGVLMPRIPEMDSVWTPWTTALKSIILGQDPQEVLTTAVEEIEQAIEERKR